MPSFRKPFDHACQERLWRTDTTFEDNCVRGGEELWLDVVLPIDFCLRAVASQDMVHDLGLEPRRKIATSV